MEMPKIIVLDRQERSQDFDFSRISNAIEKAYLSVSGNNRQNKQTGKQADNHAIYVNPTPTQIATEVTGQILAQGKLIISIEEIQNLVEARLVHHRLYDIAKAYMLYRARHETLRSLGSAMLNIEKTMDGYLQQSDWRVNENANVNYSLGGLILHNSGALTANYWLKHIYSPAIAEAHSSGAFHIHDLSMFSGYCAGWSIRQLITDGLGGVADKISSSPPKHLFTLVQQMVNFLGIMQNEWAGAQAFSSFDTYLAPYVRADKLSYSQVKQAIQSFIFGVNTPSRWGSQAPFTNITLDWTIPEDLKDSLSIVGGVTQNYTYGDCQKEMDVINQAFLEVMIEGDAEGRGFQYPIPTYNITEDFNWESDNARLLFEMTGRYGTPYFQNFVNSDLNPGDVRSMCCRLQLDKRELRKRGGGLFGSDELTGSIGVVTINMAQIGYLASDQADFFQRLGLLMDLASESLETKRRVVQRLLDNGLFPYTKRYLGHLNNHFATIGLTGMSESCLNFLGCTIGDPEGKAFSLTVLDYMRERMVQYQETTGNLYNLEASPAEGTSYRLARHDVASYPDIITAGTPDEPYYTNSTQLPVGFTDDIFEALDHQDELQTRYTGGTVFHSFLGEGTPHWQGVAELVRTISNTYRLPYFTITPTFSICPTHGYVTGHHKSCPHCGQETEVYSRIVGYYRSLRNWNIGKKQEYKERKTYNQSFPLQVQLKNNQLNPHPAKATEVGTPEFISSWQLFTTPHCPGCEQVKKLLSSSQITYQLIDCASEPGYEQAKSLHISRMPTLLGFDTTNNLVCKLSDPKEIQNYFLALDTVPDMVVSSKRSQ
jgi:anaerobic ribonucleoside-triphosphate reductase